MARFSFNFCTCSLLDHESETQPNLSYSPADMANMTAQGRAVSSQNLEHLAFFDGTGDSDNLPLPFCRGVDLNTLWEDAQNTRTKVRRLSKAKLDKLRAEQRTPNMN